MYVAPNINRLLDILLIAFMNCLEDVLLGSTRSNSTFRAMWFPPSITQFSNTEIHPRCCVVCSDALTALVYSGQQSAVSTMETGCNVPSSHPPSWQFYHLLIPALKKATMRNKNQPLCLSWLYRPPSYPLQVAVFQAVAITISFYLC